MSVQNHLFRFTLFITLGVAIIAPSTSVYAQKNKKTAAQDLYNDLGRQDFSDERVVYQFNLPPGSEETLAMDLFCKGVIDHSFPFPIGTPPYNPCDSWDPFFGAPTLSSSELNGFYVTCLNKTSLHAITGLVSADRRTGWMIIKRWDVGSDKSRISDHVGMAHNQVLDYLTPDYPVVRKRPGRTSYGQILKHGCDVTEESKAANQESWRFLSMVYPGSTSFFMPADIAVPIVETAAADGLRNYQAARKQTVFSPAVQSYLEDLEFIMLTSSDFNSFMRASARLQDAVQQDNNLKTDEQKLLDSTVQLARSSITYWNGESEWDIFTFRKPGKGKFWADIGGFLFGVGAAVVLNANLGTGIDPLEAGTAVGGFASAVAEALEE